MTQSQCSLISHLAVFKETVGGTVRSTVKVSRYYNRQVAPSFSLSPVSPGQSVQLCQQQGSLSQPHLVSSRTRNMPGEFHSERGEGTDLKRRCVVARRN